MLSVDLFMELNGDLVWLVDDDEIDKADRVKRSYRNDVYPEEPPGITREERKRLTNIDPIWVDTKRFFRLYEKRNNFEWYSISRRRRRERMV